ncbi:MAG: rhodanese-like domain-containing protein [Cyanobacteria bacterium J069]|nr:MAG: DUF2892 domain-containing protein [Cyanobacteria bacterium J069]
MTLSSSPLLQEIDAPTLRQLILEEAVTVVDVREPGEYAAEHIPGAVLQSLSQFDPRQVALPAGHKLVLYCQSGNRSRQAAQQCFAAGFSSVSHLRGGLPTWKNQGYAVEKLQNAPISLFRQVQIVAGSLVLLGTLLGAFVSPAFLLLSGFVGAGLVFAGLTDTCAMGMLLAKLPYNQRASQVPNQQWG